MSSEPLSAERLAEIAKRARERPTISVNTYGIEAHRDRMALLAEVERLRAREAALLEIVSETAKCTDDGYGTCLCCGFEVHISRYDRDQSDDTHGSNCPGEMAEAFLASAATGQAVESEGE